MYEIVDNLRMTDIEASERYPDSYIAMRKDSMTSQMGTVLFVGDNEGELMGLIMCLDDPTYCGVREGLNLQRSLGGVVVGA
jgi:hypothetical protein